jgi:hypothetical protein
MILPPGNFFGIEVGVVRSTPVAKKSYPAVRKKRSLSVEDRIRLVSICFAVVAFAVALVLMLQHYRIPPFSN